MPADLRISEGVSRGEAFHLEVDGAMVPAFPGETVAGALIAAGRYVLRYTAKAGSPRGVFCGIGYCHDCRMTIDGVPNTRACLAAARPHLRVSTEGVRYPAGPLE